MKVASYCRVSTDREDQANSFEAQQRYFREYIQRHPDWELHEVYADEGISGTGTRKRAQFNRMIGDAYDGKFRLIITKEVSRFSRNIVDTIIYTRELKAMGIGVLFLNDGIDTRESDAELRLSIMASIAQEESRKTSARVVWGQTRQMEQGVVFGRSMLGYDVRDGKLTIEPEGAEVVRLIFHKYAAEQAGTSEIARFLTAKGYRTYRGSHQWRANMVIKILNNEKYVGDLVQKKSYTPDYLTHEKKRNCGQVPLIRMENHHEPIISREVWNLTQARLRQNNKHRTGTDGHSNRYVFSGKIKCGVCGASFVGRQRKLRSGNTIRRWQCIREGCHIGKLVRDDDAMNMLTTALRSLHLDRNEIVRDVAALIANTHSGEGACGKDHLRREMERITRKKETLLDSFLEGTVSGEDLRLMNSRYDSQLQNLRERIAREDNASGDPRQEVREQLMKMIDGESQSQSFCKHLLESLTVYPDRRLELRLKNLPHVFHFAWDP